MLSSLNLCGTTTWLCWCRKSLELFAVWAFSSGPLWLGPRCFHNSSSAVLCQQQVQWVEKCSSVAQVNHRSVSGVPQQVHSNRSASSSIGVWIHLDFILTENLLLQDSVRMFVVVFQPSFCLFFLTRLVECLCRILTIKVDSWGVREQVLLSNQMIAAHLFVERTKSLVCSSCLSGSIFFSVYHEEINSNHKSVKSMSADCWSPSKLKRSYLSLTTNPTCLSPAEIEEVVSDERCWVCEGKKKPSLSQHLLPFLLKCC